MAVRMSQLAKCPRMAVYGALGTIPDDQPWDHEEAFFRGKVYEAVAALKASAEYGSEHDGRPNIERQVVIPWDLGEGHADVYVRSARKIIEVKSSVDDSDVPLLDGIQQCGLYAFFHPEAELGEVWFFDPRSGSFKPLRVPVEVPSADQVQQLITKVQDAIAAGSAEGIDRVCSHPRDARPHLCPFVGPCFETWAEPVRELEGDTLALIEDLAAQWVAIKAGESSHKAAADEANAQRKEIEQRLRDLVDVGKTDAGGFQVTRTQVSGSLSLPLKKAISSGLWTDAHDEVFGQLITERKGHERWKVEPLVDAGSHLGADPASTSDDQDVPF